MPPYAERVKAALAEFDARLAVLDAAIAATAPRPGLSAKTLADARKATVRARESAARIGFSIDLIVQTGLDVVDMQVRLQGEAALLASALTDLDELVENNATLAADFRDELLPLREQAARVAASLFPGAAAGLREVNVKLWDFQKLLWFRFTEKIAQLSTRPDVPIDQLFKMQKLADEIWKAFDVVNELLEMLAQGRVGDAAAVQQKLDDAPDALTDALDDADDALDKPSASSLNDFKPLIKQARGIADDVAKRIKKLVVPVFPAHALLGPVGAVIDNTVYDDLGGAQAFALLNILSRMQATTANGNALLDNRNAEVKEVFADRVYFEIDATLIADLKAECAAANACFSPAPAGLHRFKDGSFKQTTFNKGNLQISFAAHTTNANRVMIDADIDLFKHPLPHLFGEVLVNHLTGSKTNQLEVRKILDGQQIAAIGGFAVIGL